PSADPNVPLVFVEIAGRAHLVDGHHRLERGRRLGLSVVPVLVLRDEATLRAAMRDSTTVLRYWWIWGVQRWWRRRARSPADGF
ncbi:MAG TPA: ParB N-terminal domain-containing protein, partial [Thermoplasmata archaeon]|nr:ParB N-terminal domain-containing protein [Thermoplasmata archaeon]